MMAYIHFQEVALAVIAVIAIVGLIFRFDKYKTKHPKEGFKKTGEKFIEKGKLVEVYYNPKTGERTYKESKS